MPYYDFEKLNAIPLHDICSNYGIKLRETATGFIGKVRDESTASFSISKSKGVWSDFGMAESGKTAISLMQYLEGGIDYKEASEKLANMFNIEPEKGNSSDVFLGLNNMEYKELGIDPNTATSNYPIIDLSKQSVDEAEKLNQKYCIPMKEVAKQDIKMHNKIVETKSIRLIIEERVIFSRHKEQYYKRVGNKDIYSASEKCKYGEWLIKNTKKINRYVDLLEKGTKGDWGHLRVNFDDKEIDHIKVFIKEYCEGKNIEEIQMIAAQENIKIKEIEIKDNEFRNDLSNKKINIGNPIEESVNKEIGKVPYSELKISEGTNRYLLVNKEQFEKIKNSELNYSAFTKENNKINIIYKERDLEILHETITNPDIQLIVKEKDLEKTLNTVGKNFEKQNGNIKYSELKKLGELDYMLVDKAMSVNIFGNLNNSIKLCAFNKEDGKVNLAFLKKDKEKVFQAEKKLNIVTKNKTR